MYGPEVVRVLWRAGYRCVYEDGCPFEADSAECQARSNRHNAGECPDVTTVHLLRRGLTTYLDKYVPKRVASGRCDVSVDVLTENYDKHTEH